MEKKIPNSMPVYGKRLELINSEKMIEKLNSLDIEIDHAIIDKLLESMNNLLRLNYEIIHDEEYMAAPSAKDIEENSNTPYREGLFTIKIKNRFDLLVFVDIFDKHQELSDICLALNIDQVPNRSINRSITRLTKDKCFCS